MAQADDLTMILRDVRAGLPSATDRMEEAAANAQYYELHNDCHLELRIGEDQDHFNRRPKQTSAFTRSVVDLLARDIWSPGPTRTFAEQVAGAWVEKVYAREGINARFTELEKDAQLNCASCIEVWPTGDPDRPIRLWNYGAEEFTVYFTEDDPQTPAAVCTKNQFGLRGQTRYQLWTPENYYLYHSRPQQGLVAWGPQPTTRMECDLVKQAANPYGVLPFVFHWAEPPVKGFWSRGIGTELRRTNEILDELLSTVAELCVEYGLPHGFARNAAPEWHPLLRPGGYQAIPPRSPDPADQQDNPEVYLVEASMIQVEALWSHVKQSANMKLEELGVPATLVYSDGSTDLSGVAVVSKAMPHYERTRKRQGAVLDTEQSLARMVLLVSGVHYEEPTLLAASADPGLTVDFAEPSMPLPSPEALAITTGEMAAGLKSRVEVLMERRGLTRNQAVAALRQILEDEKAVRALEAEYQDPPLPTPGIPAPAVAVADPHVAPVAAAAP